MFSEDGISEFVRRLHATHVQDGLPCVSSTFMVILRHPNTLEVLEHPGFVRIDEERDNADVASFCAAVRQIAKRASAVACVSAFMVAIGERVGAVMTLESLAVAYLVEHSDPSLTGRCWSAKASVDDESEEVHVDKELTEYAELADVVGPFARLLPEGSLN